MRDTLKSIFFIIVLILISNWGAGYISSLKSARRANTISNKKAKMLTSCQDSFAIEVRNQNVK
jgi:hypothetical protein